MRFGSLFAGIGGFDLGLERAGMECVWQVEIDPYCQKVLAKHWPQVKRYDDVRECGEHNLETVDLICGGFPCQPHSVAGKRRGATDNRNLWPEYLRILAELRPRWMLGENVPGIITTMLDEVLSDLESQGYTATTIVLPAVAFDAPHRRDRVFIAAYTDSIGRTWWTNNERQTAPKRDGITKDGADVADTNGPRLAQRKSERDNAYPQHSPIIRDSDKSREETRSHSGQWATEPNVGRVADGVPHRMDRLRALGNAVVPQVAEWIGRRIVAFDTSLKP